MVGERPRSGIGEGTGLTCGWLAAIFLASPSPGAAGMPGLTASSPQDAPGAWPTTEWKVECYRPEPKTWYGTDQVVDASEHGEYLEQIRPFISDGSCEGADPGTPVSRVAQELERVSEWLQEQGFGPPALPRGTDGAYRAYLYPRGTRYCYMGECETRPRFLQICERLTAFNRLFTVGTQANVAHELFHAVQYGYEEFQASACRSGEDPLGRLYWITEGTAEAVEHSWIGQLDLATRSFTEPLERRAPRAEAYDDAAFWRAVSREYSNEETYEYLTRLFEKALDDDAVAAVDQTFREAFDEPLEDVYTRVVAEQWDEDRFYDGPEEIELTTEDPIRRRRETASPVGTRAYRVRVRVPPDSVGGLEVRVPEGLDAEHLHLVVGRDRYDTGPEGEPRNRFFDAVPGVDTTYSYLVRIANVSESPRENIPAETPADFRLTTWEGCDGEAMMAAAGDEYVGVEAGGVRPTLSAEEYQARFEADGALHPAVGLLRFQGLVSDAGVGCTDPLGTNPLYLLQLREGPDVNLGRAVSEMLEARLDGVSPEERTALMMKLMSYPGGDGTLAGAAQMLAGLGDEGFAEGMAKASGLMGNVLGSLDPSDPPGALEGDALIQVFVPNGFSWQHGMPREKAQGSFLTEHGGIGGWSPNAAGLVALHLPGTSPKELREDSTYEARLLPVRDGSWPDVYWRWDGPQVEKESGGWVIGPGGWWEVLRADGEWTGQVTVTEVTGATVEGRFHLSGPAVLDHWTFEEFTRDGDDDITGNRGSITTESAPIFVAGRFRAPAAVEASRPARTVAFTYATEARSEEGEEEP